MATITGTEGADMLRGTNGDDRISDLGGNDVVIGSKGNDILNGGGIGLDFNNTLDYSQLGRAVTILPSVYVNALSKYSPSIGYEVNIAKGDFGTDKIDNFSKIIGAANKQNTIDASLSDAKNVLANLDVNLANNSLKVTAPSVFYYPPNSNLITYFQYEVINFTNVIGSKNDDSIVGGNKNSKLTGGGGNDTITGGNKNDRITGSDPTARGVGEVDTLTGGGGKDKFVLGDKNGAYYVGNGNSDYATITDFNLFQDSIDLGNLNNNYSFGIESTGTIDLFSGKDINTRDLIAKIQLADAGSLLRKGSNSSSKSASILGESGLNLDPIVSKIDILSGSSYTTDT
jgi:Ca2+-binding RTX toxin-like protein